ncbi:right-handed parallel beta-helix repeat-containing protein [Sphingosinicella rhizophila]|uniref:Right-handed parallel beta-helix repeat-containing protein n=1 Tax=Sphingosinicella rhizophila TaxID=3050082 RepID=A0ABU3Q3H9_9SPHN|nr:right-handed parallel beta-helix repeat-containing protein [Sphingosinicella sp. GR2756]MDT9597960.1 right-handed parallel beta-helix repeat-containing protein [Sphingosinicella sp. GR2756]
MMKKRLALIAATLLAGPLPAQDSEAPFLVREQNRAFGTLQQAVDAIGDGSGTIEIAPGNYRQCAVQEAGQIAFAAREPGTVTFDRKTCEGKAVLVLRGRSASVDGIIFQNIRVPDANGAGIRIERGDLIVTESLFRDSESGILSAADPSGTVRIERSTFAGLGRCDRDLDCAHSIYIGNYGRLVVRRSRFERGTGGHYVKSRTARIEVSDSSFDDTAGKATNYMIDLSEGATGTIARNMFVQGRDKENYSALIMVAAEGQTNSSEGLDISDNDASIAPGIDRSTSFVADKSGDSLRIADNRLGPRIARFEQR